MPVAAASPTPLDALWQPRAVVSVLLAGEALALLLTVAPGASEGRLVYFGLASLMIQWIALLTLGSLYSLRAPLARMPGRRVAWVAVALLVTSVWLVAGIACWLMWDVQAWRRGWLPMLLQVTVIALTVGLLGVAALENHWRNRLLALRAKQAELEALQARIRPHFLFNTLNTGAALVHARPGEAERLLLDLADLFRAALAGPHEIALADELALARRYLEIEALRFGPRLQVHWQLPEPIPAVMVPALSVQPLVENAIRHGVEPAADGGRVDVCVQSDGDGVRVIVGNDLPPAGAVLAAGHQVGLASARERVAALTDGRGRVETRIADGRYVATIHLPAVTAA